MEKLSIKKNNLTLTNNLIRIGDLAYFEGPLLTLFEEVNSGYLYLFDWVDRNNTFNRWLIYRISPSALYRFITNQISHLELFKSNPDNKFYTADIETKHSFFDCTLSELNEVPSQYLPNIENYFDEIDSLQLNKIKATTVKALTRKKQENEYFQSENTIQILTHNTVKRTAINKISFTQHVTFEDNLNFHFLTQPVICFISGYNQLNHSTTYSNKNLQIKKMNKVHA